MKNLQNYITESKENFAKYDDNLVKKAIVFLRPLLFDSKMDKNNVIKLSNEAKGYSFMIKSGSTNKYQFISYLEVNDFLKHHKDSI